MTKRDDALTALGDAQSNYEKVCPIDYELNTIYDDVEKWYKDYADNLEEVKKDVTDGWKKVSSKHPFWTTTGFKISGDVKSFYDTFLKYCEAMVVADSDEAKETKAGSDLWKKLETNVSSSKAEAMAQALARLLADTDEEANEDGKYDSCSSQIGEVISAEVDKFVTEKNDKAVIKNETATKKTDEDNVKN